MVGREHEEPFCAGIDYTECWTLELSIQDLAPLDKVHQY